MGFGDSQIIHPENLERDLRIQRMVDELQELAGGRLIMGHSASCPPEIMEAFLQEVLAFEREEARRREFPR
ncbi:MAG TPA: hypothetical protein DCM86_06580 [Verrucomicrobiales bacterium]|nr:hypothetical protein [Verrucomicrobiales bacterium]